MIFGRRRTAKDAPEQQASTPSAAATDGDATGAPPLGPGARTAGGTRPAGLRLTEGLLPIFGPAQVGDSKAPVRPASEAERGRDSELRTTLTRMVGADGQSYVVAVPEERAPAGDRPPADEPGADEAPGRPAEQPAEGTSTPGRDS